MSANQLAGAASPYLLQHADNPVHWRPWSPAVFEEARARNCPILLSVGYSACHWCHVMAHESFENEATASVMNAHFVNVKVDREERPEIDQIYMAALTAMGVHGGWPLTMFLTPDGKPFYGGTYYPPTARHGQPAFTEILDAIRKAWTERRGDIETSADSVHAHLADALDARNGRAALDPATADALAAGVFGLIDHDKGGLRGAPKFPSAPFMESLWLSALRSGNADHRDAFVTSLRAMLNGGIYDHVGGGLCRYSTDTDWLVPHFEKMLYDNAAMLRHANWVHAATGEKLFRLRIEQTVAWLSREMLTGDGAFASSLDADSEGVEGKYYVWSRTELDAVLGKDDAALAAEACDITERGNWEGVNIPNRSNSPVLDASVEDRLGRICARLLAYRTERIAPGRDDKVITEWNAMMIRALTECASAFDRDDWLDMARQAYSAIAGKLGEAGRLPHCYSSESVTAPALSSDYAAMINAAVALHEATPDAAYIDDARRWEETLLRDHGDGEGGYYLTAASARDVPIRTRGDRDEAISGATAQIAEALHRLSLATGDTVLADRARICAEGAAHRIAGQQYGQAGILNAVAMLCEPLQLAFTGETPGPLPRTARRLPDPRRVTLPPGADTARVRPEIDSGKPAAWLCRAMTCLPPIADADELEKVLRESQNLPA